MSTERVSMCYLKETYKEYENVKVKQLPEVDDFGALREAGINFLIGAFVTVELIGEGHEGAMYGLLAIVAILSSPFAATLTKVVDNWLWGLSNERVQVDDYTVRRDVTEAVLLMYGMSVVSWLFLFLLPRQMETQDLKHDGGSSTLFGMLTVGYLFVALIWSITTNIMGIFATTNFLLVAGENGC
ncbi:hypothetical protein PPTG_08691 [Phytophthora nicotianae INRA-310]|uniref:Uncharacterized protein n=1 Tax=Phytophthora nicotianae (strain INRA-310) TaxID=761204 RepID=W2QM64_PHYN3|nr:hypothetical protein PPTG_08691 [Phytophthora nicotianae INRA-310]ETN14036.1 hypothetical protein PPTG_08691 [Phytophthora nicotianae INRA-310]